LICGKQPLVQESEAFEFRKTVAAGIEGKAAWNCARVAFRATTR